MKINKILSCFIAVMMAVNLVSPTFAAAKRDVNDPVLREIINELSRKMPKFIDKYGESLFVEDEPMTRGTFLAALYEYDRLVKGGTSTTPGKPLISREEFDNLRSRVSSVEKTASTPTTPKSLISREEFDNLKSRVLSVEKTASTPTTVKSLISKEEFDNLRNRVSSVEKTAANAVTTANAAKTAAASASTSIATTSVAQIDMSKIIPELEPNMPSLLDKSLKNSKVFKDLQAQVAKGGTTTVVDDSAAIKAVSKDIKNINARIDSLSNSDNSAAITAVSKDIKSLNARIDSLSKQVSSLESMPSSSTEDKSSYPSKKEIAEMKKTLAQIQTNYVALSKKIDDIDISAASVPSSSGGDNSYLTKQINEIRKTVEQVPTSKDIQRVQKEIDKLDKSKNQTQSDIERIESKLNNIASSSYSSSSGGGEGSSSKSGATIATISLGITMIAALFVAR